MNDSTPETPMDLPEAEPAMVAKTPAAQRAPRKKAAPVAAADATEEVAPEESREVDEDMAGPAKAEPTLEAPAGLEGQREPRVPRPQMLGVEQRSRGRHPAAAAVQGYAFADVVSGRFDEDDASADAVPAKRVLLPQVESPKLHKV